MFQFPLDRISVTSRFIIYAPFGTKTMHYGMDYGCAVGTNVYAANDGEVVYSGFDSAGGNMIIINGKNELSRYAHLSTRLVNKGQTVKRGELIGYSGATGSACAGAHLHFETWLTPDNYVYSYADKPKYAVDPMSVCHILGNQTFSYGSCPTKDPIPYPEPVPEKSSIISCQLKIKEPNVRMRTIPETKSYQYICGGYNRSSDVFGDFLPLGTYPVIAVAYNDGYDWALIQTVIGEFWIAIIDGLTELEGYISAPTQSDDSETIEELKNELAAAKQTIEKLEGTIDLIRSMAIY